MSVFGIFISPQEFKFKELMKNKPNMLMYTSKKILKGGYVISPINNEELKKNVVITTSSDKISYLHLLDPFFSFTFDKDEYGVIILGENHNLLNLDKETAYIYSIDSDKFLPIVDKQGNHDGRWYSEEGITIDPNIQPQKIKFIDVLRMGIQVFWVNSIETLKQIDEEMNEQEIKTGEQKLEYLINQTNWKSDKVVYMNKYKNISPVKIDENGYVIDYSKKGKNKKD